MRYEGTLSGADMMARAIHRTFRALPIACFPLALLSDIAYWQTSNLLWLHISEWLLLAGVIGVALFHHHVLQVALVGLAVVTLYKLGFTGFKTGPGLGGGKPDARSAEPHRHHAGLR